MNFKGSQFEKEIILWGVRWYVAYPISYRQLEEMMGERGVTVAHSTLNRWVIKYAPEYITNSYVHAPALLLPNATYDALIGHALEGAGLGGQIDRAR